MTIIQQFIATILFCVLLLAGTPTWAAPTTAPGDHISYVETQLFSRTYSDDSTQKRLARIEELIYGEAQSKQSESERLKALQTRFKKPEPLPQKPQQAKQHPQEAPSQTYEVSDSESKYPAIVAMEQRVFKQTYEKDPIQVRLARLEKEVLKQEQHGSLQQRTDQLKMMVLGDNPASGGHTPQPYTTYQSGGTQYNVPSSLQTGSPQHKDLMQALTPIEQRVLGQTFPHDTAENRVGRLEMAVFNSKAPEMPLNDRLYRVVSVVSSQENVRRHDATRQRQAKQGAVSRYGPTLMMILFSLI